MFISLSIGRSKRSAVRSAVAAFGDPSVPIRILISRLLRAHPFPRGLHASAPPNSSGHLGRLRVGEFEFVRQTFLPVFGPAVVDEIRDQLRELVGGIGVSFEVLLVIARMNPPLVAVDAFDYSRGFRRQLLQ